MKEVGFGTLNWVAVIIYIYTSYVPSLAFILPSARAKVPIVSLPQVVACHLG